MKRLSKTHMSLTGILISFAAAGWAPPAHAVVVFVNNTKAPVTDFHVDEFTTFVIRIPKSSPWGDGKATSLGDNMYTISYSGKAIPVGGQLRFEDGAFTDDTSHEFSNFTWTPGGEKADSQHGVGTVPEPSVWLTMLAGFGAIGATMRSRRGMAVSFG